MIHYSTHIPPLKMWRHLEKVKLNEPGRQKLGRYRSLVSSHSTQSYNRTYYGLRRREPLIALGCHFGLNFCIRGTPPMGQEQEKRKCCCELHVQLVRLTGNYKQSDYLSIIAVTKKKDGQAS